DPSRHIRIQGWAPVPAAPSTFPAPAREVEVPWLRWPGHDEQGGTLTVVAPSKFQLVGGEGMTMVSSDPQGVGPGVGSSYRVACRLTRPGEVARPRWQAEPPRVGVQVESQLTIDADSAAWTAVVRYDVWGGPLDAIHLKLPTEWARGATVRLAGAP